MQPSQACIDLVKSSEGCRLTAYRDGGGRLTIGWGHTAGVSDGQTITQDEADSMLVDDIDAAAEQVAALVTVPLTQGQFDACSDFLFNLGAGRFGGSTLLRLLNQGNYQGAANQFQYWIYDAGKVEQGLVTRRAAERVLFEVTA